MAKSDLTREDLERMRKELDEMGSIGGTDATRLLDLVEKQRETIRELACNIVDNCCCSCGWKRLCAAPERARALLEGGDDEI